MTVPADIEAERSLLGSMLRTPSCIPDVAAQVAPEDFYKPSHGLVFASLIDLHAAGERVVPTSLREAMTADATLAAAGGPEAIFDLMGAGDGAWKAAARLVTRLRGLRSVLSLASDAVTAAADATADPSELVERMQEQLATVAMPVGRLPKGLKRLDDILDAPPEARSPWVVPGLLRRDWRVIVVAPEGQGKTHLLQTIAIAASQGIHPLTQDSVPPVKVLIIDLENPEERIVDGCTPVRVNAQRMRPYDGDRLMIWHEPAGIDLRTRSSVAELQAVLESVRPELVVMGPAYKASTRHKGEGWDESAAAVQQVLDRMRTRYKFGLLMEDHAPQSSGGVRDLRPFGSSLWLRWPEIGLKLSPESEPPKPRVLALKRWRGDRLPNAWPDRITESRPWPWSGVWDQGAPRYEQEIA